MQVEQLKTSHVLRAKVHFDVGTVEQCRPCARCTEEVVCLIQHTSLIQTFAEHLEIARTKHTRVFFHFLVVRIHLELAGFVTNNWKRTGIHCFIEVHASVGISVIDISSIIGVGKGEGTTRVGVEFLVAFTTRSACSEIVHAFLPSLIAEVEIGTESEEFFGTNLAELIHKLLHLRYVAPQFIAQSHHHKRRMMPIGFQYFLSLVEQETHQAQVLGIEVTPERQFGLQVNA